MFKVKKFTEENSDKSFTFFHSDNFEYVNPYQYLSELFISSNMRMMIDLIRSNNPEIPLKLVEQYIRKKAQKEWLAYLKELEETPIPQNIISLLKTNSKKEQLKFLKNLSISQKQMRAFVFKTSKEYNYTYSHYRGEKFHSGLDITELPEVLEIKDGIINRIGETKLTEGQLKQALRHRKVIIAKFFDQETTWHCFFLTFESLKGKETWKDGLPHYHYISDKFGIPRQKVVEQLKSCKYNLGTLPHIEIVDYKNAE
jgi:hypothetical protein